MRKEKTWNLMGLIVGIIVIIVGVVFVTSPPESHVTGSVKDCTFGADFYTYQYKATQTAVDNAAVAANNIRELGEKLALYSGAAFIVAGTLIALHYGKKFFTTGSKIDAAYHLPVPPQDNGERYTNVESASEVIEREEIPAVAPKQMVPPTGWEPLAQQENDEERN